MHSSARCMRVLNCQISTSMLIFGFREAQFGSKDHKEATVGLHKHQESCIGSTTVWSWGQNLEVDIC